MIITIALAAALAGPDVYIDADGCRWLRKAAPAVPHTVAKAASAPVRAKPKKRNFLPNAIPGYDPIGCDEGAPPGPIASLFAPEMPLAEYTPVPAEFVPMLPLEGLYVVPVLLPVDDEVRGPGIDVPGVPVFGGGGGVVLVPAVPAVPEPSTWVMLLGGVLLGWWRKRHIAKTGHTFRSPGRDTWPVDMKGLGEAFASGREIRKSNRTTPCRVCSL